MNVRLIMTSCLLMVTLIACSRTAAPTPDAETGIPSPEALIEESPLSPPATPTPPSSERMSPLPDPASSPLEPSSAAVNQAVEAAKARLAQKVGVAPSDIETVAIEVVEWSDASLGCPKPGRAYAQVITPGYRVVLEAHGRQYELHTDQSGGSVVICELKQRRSPDASVVFLAQELGIPTDQVEVLSVEADEWPDASLGCPEPGRSYAQVATPGYRVILQAAGEEYEVHIDKRGKIAVLCETER